MVVLNSEKKKVFMAMAPERSKPLHNFTLPCGLRWGNQRFLKCVKVNSNGEASAVDRMSYGMESSVPHRRENNEIAYQRRGSFDRGKAKEGLFKAPPEAATSSRKSRSESGDGEDGIAAAREKLMFDLQTAADKMKDAILRDGMEDEQGEHKGDELPGTVMAITAGTSTPVVATLNQSEAADSARPWNLRTRRAACKVPNGLAVGGGSGNGTKAGLQIDPPKPVASSPLRIDNNKSPKLRSGFCTGASAAAVGASSKPEKSERKKFSISISRSEIEEDFIAVVGHRPPRRPKKRAKGVQKTLDGLFPGLWLTEITPDLYKVSEPQ